MTLYVDFCENWQKGFLWKILSIFLLLVIYRGSNISPDTFRTKTGQWCPKSGHRQKFSNMLKIAIFSTLSMNAEGWRTYKVVQQQFQNACCNRAKRGVKMRSIFTGRSPVCIPEGDGGKGEALRRWASGSKTGRVMSLNGGATSNVTHLKPSEARCPNAKHLDRAKPGVHPRRGWSEGRSPSSVEPRVINGASNVTHTIYAMGGRNE